MNKNIKNIFRINKIQNNNRTKLLENDRMNIIIVNKDNINKLVNSNAEKERLELIKKLELPFNATWKDIVNKNDNLIEKQSIRIK